MTKKCYYSNISMIILFYFYSSLRGGVEHGVGHFVSSVDSGSVAESQGMKAGDQFLTVDRLPLISATHKEAVALISSRKKVSF